MLAAAGPHEAGPHEGAAVDRPIIVLYHGDPHGESGCADGFTAAWAIWRKVGDEAHYLPCCYGEPPPFIPDLKQKTVFVVDISWPRRVMDRLYEEAGSLLVLDHHDTAAQELDGAPYACFRQDKSGARLAWEFFHEGLPVPPLVQFVEDRDLWRFEIDNSRAVNAVVGNTPRQFPVWETLHQRLLAPESLGYLELLNRGEGLLREQERLVAGNCKGAHLGQVAGMLLVPVVNATCHISETGERLLREFPDYPFVAMWQERRDGSRRWNLRSRKLADGRASFHVGEFARQFGGGGHPCAAGFIERPPDLSMVVHDLTEFLHEAMQCLTMGTDQRRTLIRRYESWRQGKTKWLSLPEGKPGTGEETNGEAATV